MSKIFNPLLPFGLDETGSTAAGSGTGTLTTIKDEGITLSSVAVSVDFVGSGVTATNIGSAITVTIPGGSSSLAVQDFQKEWTSATTWYEGIAAKGTAVGTATWSLVKTTLTGNDYETRNIYTASDTWNNRVSASYTLSNSYSY